MHFKSLSELTARGGLKNPGAPAALVLIEDEVEVESTLRHHLQAGFDPVVALMPPRLALPEGIAPQVLRVDYDTSLPGAMETAVNTVIAAAPGRWLYYCFNAEYLFYPFCETRTVGEMLRFHGEERRDAMLTYVVDLYAEDLTRSPDAVSLEHAMFDRSGYYALAREDPEADYAPQERQLDFFGGLRWRFEEHVPWERRAIGRIALFRAKPGLRLGADHHFNEAEYNTYACQWHHNLTAAICSFRTAKALMRNPGSRDAIDSFTWRNSRKFEWHSQQLLDLGLIEPGQWF